MKFKKWLENFWYYHKWATIITIVVLICLLVSGRQLFGGETSDLKIMLIGEHMMEDSNRDAAQLAAAGDILRDITGDGEVHITPSLLHFTGEAQNDYMLFNALMVDLAAGESRVFLMEREYIKHISEGEILLSLKDEIREEQMANAIQDEHGNVIAVPVTNFALAEEMGFLLPNDTYIAVRAITPTEEKTKGIEEKEENALRFFRAFTE